MMRIKSTIIAFFLLVSFQCVFSQLSENERFDVTKHLDVYNSIVKELNLHYVDSLDMKDLGLNNINALTSSLDPYTTYIPEEDMLDFQFQTTGEYGGIGSIISMKDGQVIVLEPYEGMPADVMGLQPGDVILEIDGVSMKDQTTLYASERLKGLPNTIVKVKIQRIGEKKPREISITRKRIHVDQVAYYTVLEGGVGYIHLSGFMTESAQSVKAALLDLTQNHHINSLIFDVRDNGGGSVDECLEMLNFFLPKGELLLSMRGKSKQMDRTYRSTQEPLEPTLPLAVLVNHNSASASEIFSGAIQDLDRGIIIGQRTYGKGLVQSTRPLPYNGQLKLTISKYYIPSGRCIQAINYAKRNEDGSLSAIPDSLTNVFYTAKGRPVKDGGGILPDIVMDKDTIPTMLYYMEGDLIFFDFVSQWRQSHPKISSPADFEVTDELYEEFKEFVKKKDFTYDRQSEKVMASLKRIMEFEGYMDTASEEFQALENKLKPNLDGDLERHKDEISYWLGKQIMKQYYYNKGAIIYSLKMDEEVKRAIKELTNYSLNLD